MFNPLPIKEIKKESTDNRVTFLLHYLAYKNLWYEFKKWDNTIWGIIEELSPKQFLVFWDSQSMLDASFSNKQTTYTIKDWTPFSTPEDIEVAKKYISSHIESLKKNNIHIKMSNEANQHQYIEAD
ncbi:hypothetical protein J0J34_09975 (plasmid) [Lactococcus garvieae]|nr:MULTISPECIES: hypothetical protein [Lactococcus]MDT2563549.1 hypothetical protein [Lactococcus petauri]QSR01194.1 hypothetical protein J0J34_09975 [Lactococcus garvieae]QSR13885.1 hypothetical protein J0J35_10975 [Lactococcus sp. LG606]